MTKSIIIVTISIINTINVHGYFMDMSRITGPSRPRLQERPRPPGHVPRQVFVVVRAQALRDRQEGGRLQRLTRLAPVPGVVDLWEKHGKTRWYTKIYKTFGEYGKNMETHSNLHV